MSEPPARGPGGDRAEAEPAPPPAAARGVLPSVSRLTGRPAQVSLRPESGSGDPVIDPRSELAELVPPGRGNYRVLGEIARGGMGVVMRAHDADLGRDVALKVLHERLAGDGSVVERFVEEAQIGGQLQHPSIVSVYELGLMADERPYFTMKLVKGRTLAALLTDRADPAEDRHRFLGLFEQICQAVAYAHSRGVIHRDLKPANVMVGAFGELQVVDWGLAKVMARGGVEDERRAQRSDVGRVETVRSGPDSQHSQVGSVLGTPAYMAPEQARGELEGLDERADVFSLGAILTEILTGRPPYEGEDVVVQAACARLEPARERLAACGADPELVALAERCLAPDPAERPRNASRLAEAVQEHLAGVERRAREAQLAAAEASAHARQERRARRLTLALAVSVLVTALVAGGSYAGFRAAREQQTSEVNAVLREASARRGQGDLEGALREAEKAELLVASGAPAELEQLVRAFAEEVGAEAQRARAAADERERRARLLAGLEQVFYRQDLGSVSEDALRRRDAQIVSALAGYGFDVEADPDVDRAILAAGLGEPVALALDELSRTRRLLPEAERSAAGLTRLAVRVDPDPQRNELRSAVAEERVDDLHALATPENARAWPAVTSALLVLSLRDAGRIDERTVDFLREAVDLHPGHYQLQIGCGIQLLLAGRVEQALPHLTAARALQPESSYALWWNHEAQALRLDLAAARRTWTTALQVDPAAPEVVEMRRRQISLRLVAGDEETAWRLYDEQPEWARVARGVHYDEAAWGLANAARAELRDVERALEYAARAALELPSDPGVLTTLASAEYRAGKHARALETIELARRTGGPPSSENLALAAMTLARLGRSEDARAELGALARRLAASPPREVDVPRLFEEARVVVGE